MTTSSIQAPTSRSPSSGSARSVADSANRPARCCLVAGRCASRCRSTTAPATHFASPGERPMEMKQVSDSCYAVLNEKNRVCDANSGLINLGGGVVIDTQSDLPHARQMIELFSRVWPGMPTPRGQHARGRRPRLGQPALRGRRDHRPSLRPERMQHVAEPGGDPQAARWRAPRPHCACCSGRCIPAWSPPDSNCRRTTTSTGSNWCCRRRCSMPATSWTWTARRCT